MGKIIGTCGLCSGPVEDVECSKPRCLRCKAWAKVDYGPVMEMDEGSAWTENPYVGKVAAVMNAMSLDEIRQAMGQKANGEAAKKAAWEAEAATKQAPVYGLPNVEEVPAGTLTGRAELFDALADSTEALYQNFQKNAAADLYARLAWTCACGKIHLP